MTLVWLFLWGVSGTPSLHRWDAWLVALIVVLLIDALEAFGKASS